MRWDVKFIQTQWSTVILYVAGNFKDADVTVPKPHYCVDGDANAGKRIYHSLYTIHYGILWCKR